MPKQIARWNPARDAWEEETTGLFCEHSDVFSETWPSCGTTLGGSAYALPTPAPHTVASASSSSPGLLGTPTARDGKGDGQDWRLEKAAARGHVEAQVRLLLPTPLASEGTKPSNTMGVARRQATREVFLTNVIATVYGNDPSERTQGRVLLPTPTVSDTNGPGAHGDGGLDLRTTVSLLPTPTCQAAKHSADDRGHGTLDDGNLWSIAARIANGDSTPPPLPDGRQPWDEPLPLPLS